MRKLLLLLLVAAASAQTTTPNLGLGLPAYNQVGWQSTINNNFVLLDNFLSGNAVLPGPLIVGGDILAKSGRPVFDVMAFGAANNGVTNDAPAIQAAITAACANNGGEIFFPTALGGDSHKYLVTSTISIPCNNLIFAGVSPQVETFSIGSPSPSMIVGNTLDGPVFQTTGGHRGGITIRDLTIQGSNSLPNSIGIQFVDVATWLIENVTVGFTGGPCIQVQTGDNGGAIRNSFFTSCIAADSAADTGGIDINQPDIDVFNAYVDCGITGSSLIGTGHTFGLLLRSNSGTSHIYNLRADFCQHGVKLLSTSRNIFMGGRAFHNQGSAMIFDSISSQNQIIGFQSLGNSQDSTGTYSGFSVAGTGNIFTGNTCIANGGDTKFQKNCFDDTNSNGGDPNGVRNIYSANSAGAIGADITGSLYNFTGTDNPRVSFPRVNATQTTATGGITLTPGIDGETQLFNTVITGAVTVTLATTGAWAGARFRIIRGASATGAFNLTACGKALSSASSWVDCEYLGGAWIEAATGSL